MLIFFDANGVATLLHEALRDPGLGRRIMADARLSSARSLAVRLERPCNNYGTSRDVSRSGRPGWPRVLRQGARGELQP
jgi:hypothetical protein